MKEEETRTKNRKRKLKEGLWKKEKQGRKCRGRRKIWRTENENKERRGQSLASEKE